MLRLPAHVVDLAQANPVVRAPLPLRPSDPHNLRPRERRALLALDEVGDHRGTAERSVPLVDGRWAVGRRSGPVTIWRIVHTPDLDRLSHPAWLWASDDWFDPHQASSASFPTPARLPLRTLLAHASPLHGSGRQIIKALAACVRQLRAGQPTALVVGEEALAHAGQPARAFVLALLTVMPPAWRNPLRIAVGEPAPRPGDWSLVLTDRRPEGYHPIDVDRPGDEGTDLVAYYVRERLLADDPEALEAASFQAPPRPYPRVAQGDPWAAAVAAVLLDPPEGVADIREAAAAVDSEGAVRALAARLAAGAPLDGPVDTGTVTDRLVDLTRAHRDPRPFRALMTRPAADRARAVLAVLESVEKPTAALIDALVDAYPPGADLGPWFAALLTWLRAGVASSNVVDAVEHTLLSWPITQSSTTRASVWSEVVQALVSLGEDEAAMAALTSDVARRIVADDAGPALANLWSVIPEAFREPRRLDDLVRLLASADEPGEAMVALFQHARGSEDERRRLFRAWHAARASQDAGGAGQDALFEVVRGTPFQREWLSGLFAARDPVEAADVIAAAVDDDAAAPVWIEAEAVMVQAMTLLPGQRFLALPALVRGVDAIETIAPLRLLDAVRRPFPAPELTDVARLLLTASNPSPLWSFVAVTTAPVDRFDDRVVDAAVLDFCAMEAMPDDVREVALLCAEQLGAAEGFEPLDQARWMVRISLAPDGTRITPELTLSLVRGVLSHPDGCDRLVAITLELLELPPEHPALLAYVHFLLPQAWDDGVPARFRDAVPLHAVPPSLQAAWTRCCGAGPTTGA